MHESAAWELQEKELVPKLTVLDLKGKKSL
jgi:hypothetical protein